MKNTYVETLGKVAFALEKHLPIAEYELFMEYLGVYEALKAKNDREKQNYQEKAEYYREATRKWRQDNKERHEAYQKSWHERRRAKRNQAKERNE